MKNVMQCNFNGFTLIELLVVVLIIGILSAVALPQYQKAVKKARMTEAILTANSFRKAIHVYYLEGASEDFTLEDLDIQLPETKHHEVSIGGVNNIVLELISGIGSYRLSIYSGDEEDDNYTHCTGSDCGLFAGCQPMSIGSNVYICDF